MSKGDVEVTATMPAEDGAGRVPSSPGPPVVGWDRYELLELLGKGGMGSVYKARDRRLGRTLAIKFILGADPNLTMRFQREARAQARIDHPNICRVYEVGEVEGRAYIALQLVDGEPLHEAAARMSLDEKIAVMRDVAAAIHEAHRLGIVHRDLKPANIMVERTEDGRWLPVVMDFGLAREATAEVGLTVSGALLGTPAYMSPEQARGDVHAVDRRSDVFSLGATLYELVTGRRPFLGTALAEVLGQVIHDDPPAPRSLVPSLPADLETIALQCLAKDPALRYPSARALTDDLGRYLDGEPILGRRLSLWQRVRRRARRHRALVILGAWSLAVILVVGAFGGRAWFNARSERERAAEQARLAGRLGQDAKEIEMSLQLAYQWPLHDTRADRERVRERMKAIAATRHDLGALGDGVIHEALGRGHLALHEWQKAADELERAKAAGRRSPELHAALGRALGELYQRALEQARLTEDKGWLARKQRELARQYLTPALAELEQSRGSGEDAELLEVLIALYRGDFAAAEQRALAVAERSPGQPEARKLAGDAAYRAAVAAFDRGDLDAARPAIDRATRLYGEASEIARSDVSVYEAAARAWLQRAEVDASQKGLPRESLERALDVIDNRALRADPDHARIYTIKAYVLLRWYRTPPLAAPDHRLLLLERIAQAAERAVALDPQDPQTWTTLGDAHIDRGRHEGDYGGQSEPWWNRAREAFGKTLALQPTDLRAHTGLGKAHGWLGTSLAQTGRDPMPEYRAALRSYERASAIDPRDLVACSNQVDLHTLIAQYEYELGNDPRPAVDSAQRVGERCIEINPKHRRLLDHLTRAQLALARYLVETGRDPVAALASARGYIDRAEAVQPETMLVWFRRLTAATTEAVFQARRGGDPTRSIATGRAALQKVLQLFPDSPDAYVEAAHLDLVEAAWAAHTANAEMPLLEKALANAEKAVALPGQLAVASLTAAEVCLRSATARPSPSTVDRGIAHVEQALARNPRLARALTVRAELQRLRQP